MTKVNLNVSERITLLDVLPKVGDFIKLRISNDVTKVIGLSDEDLKEFEVKTTTSKEGFNFTWNEKGKEERELELSERGFSLIADELEKLDKGKKLEMKHFSLYEKFVEEGKV